MDASIQSVVRFLEEVWSFCWVPLVTLTLSWITIRFVYPPSLDWARKRFRSGQEKAGRLASSKDLLTTFGLSKLVPVFAVVLVVAGFMLVNNIVSTWMPVLPPTLSISAQEAAVSRFGERDQVLFLRAFPATETVPAKYMTYRHAYAEALSTARADSDLAPRCMSARLITLIGHQITKALMVVAFLTFILAVFRWKRVLRTLARFAIAILVLSLAWCVLGLTYIWEAREVAGCEFAAASHVVAVVLGPDGFGPSTEGEIERIRQYEGSMATFRENSREMLSARIVGQDWWEVSLLSPKLKQLTMRIWEEYRMWRWSLGLP